MIAHRLSTVRNAERIIVLSDDGICEEGTHEELILSDGIYANLYKLQLTFWEITKPLMSVTISVCWKSGAIAQK